MPDIDSMIDALHQYAESGNLAAAQGVADRIHNVEVTYGNQLQEMQCRLYTMT